MAPVELPVVKKSPSQAPEPLTGLATRVVAAKRKEASNSTNITSNNCVLAVREETLAELSARPCKKRQLDDGYKMNASASSCNIVSCRSRRHQTMGLKAEKLLADVEHPPDVLDEKVVDLAEVFMRDLDYIAYTPPTYSITGVPKVV